MVDPNEIGPNGLTCAENEARQQEYVRRANEALESHHDKGGRWWRYVVSHCTFELVVGDALGYGGNVVLCFLACDVVNGPMNWPNQRLRIKWLNESESWPYIVTDPSAGFYLEAGVFYWRKDFDLLEHGSPYFGADWLTGHKPTTYLGYYCSKCEFRFYGYHPYCSECGCQLPTQKKMQAMGLAVPTASASHLLDIGYSRPAQSFSTLSCEAATEGSVAWGLGPK